MSAYVIEAKGLDATDKHLRVSIQLRIVNAMRMAEKRGKAARVGKRGAVLVWALASLPTP